MGGGGGAGSGSRGSGERPHSPLTRRAPHTLPALRPPPTHNTHSAATDAPPKKLLDRVRAATSDPPFSCLPAAAGASWPGRRGQAPACRGAPLRLSARATAPPNTTEDPLPLLEIGARASRRATPLAFETTDERDRATARKEKQESSSSSSPPLANRPLSVCATAPNAPPPSAPRDALQDPKQGLGRPRTLRAGAAGNRDARAQGPPLCAAASRGLCSFAVC